MEKHWLIVNGVELSEGRETTPMGFQQSEMWIYLLHPVKLKYVNHLMGMTNYVNYIIVSKFQLSFPYK